MCSVCYRASITIDTFVDLFYFSCKYTNHEAYFEVSFNHFRFKIYKNVGVNVSYDDELKLHSSLLSAHNNEY